MDTIFISIINPEEPRNAFFCISGTIVRLYLNTYQLYQVLITKAASRNPVVISKINILCEWIINIDIKSILQYYFYIITLIILFIKFYANLREYSRINSHRRYPEEIESKSILSRQKLLRAMLEFKSYLHLFVDLHIVSPNSVVFYTSSAKFPRQSVHNHLCTSYAFIH